MRAWAAGAAVLLLALLLAAVLLAPGGGRPGFERGDLLVCVNGGGDLELYWPGTTSPGALYHLEVTCGGLHEERYCSRPAARLSGLPEGEELQVRVWAAADGKDLFGRPREVRSWKTFRAGVVLPGDLEAPEAAASPEGGALRWTGEGELYQVFRTDGAASPGGVSGVPVASTAESGLPLPPEGEGLGQFIVRAGWKKRGFILCGPASLPVEPGGPDLPGGGRLSLTCRETAPCLCVLEWEGTRCHHFEVQRWTGEAWRTAARLTPEAHMRYDPGRLGSGSYNRFRVAAVGADGGEEQAEETELYASVSPLYSTVWPIQDLTLYEDPGKGERLASVPGGAALCVLAEEGDWFRVCWRSDYGWVDSRFCMINLPEYTGDHCAYVIANGERSLFAAHNAPIPQITGQVIKGFEHVRTAEGEFLAPYLYPCAQKLLSAALAAQADGYRLKIYEAFRPQEATRFLYDTAEARKNDPAATEDGRQTTLLKLMTDNGRFSLGSFLARSISAHNRGIALDLTLERADGGGELEMQSAMHDLSWYAATDRSNLNAKLLAGYMTGVGMKGLSSEWWHFQDDETRAAIGLNASLYGGVSAEGWTQDDAGWRYRGADGSYVRDAVRTVDGRTYIFDKDGYAAA